MLPRSPDGIAWAMWWLGGALAGLVSVLTLQHALAGAPLILVAPQAPAAPREPAGGAPAAAASYSSPSRPDAVPAAGRALPALPAMASIPGVPFTPQAPQGDWSLPFGEACEEASVLMAVSWARGVQTLSPAQAEREILDQVAFENYAFGYNHDTSLAQTLKLFTRHYGYRNASLRYDITLEDIKRELAGGSVVLVPVAGALLKNPYYASPPPYHMIVIRGYDDVAGEFIANDPGTRYGADFRYPYDRLWGAIHDWTGADETILAGRTGMIVVKKPQSEQ